MIPGRYIYVRLSAEAVGKNVLLSFCMIHWPSSGVLIFVNCIANPSLSDLKTIPSALIEISGALFGLKSIRIFNFVLILSFLSYVLE